MIVKSRTHIQTVEKVAHSIDYRIEDFWRAAVDVLFVKNEDGHM